ncbi:MAG TPA: MFS transporter [Pirellulaceae bacterium]|jgi:MFS family permease|nr:MFS transporter [Pirellulaceae bacterium]
MKSSDRSERFASDETSAYATPGGEPGEGAPIIAAGAEAVAAGAEASDLADAKAGATPAAARDAHAAELERRIEAAAPRNFWALVAFSVVLRISWIFKTESVIMPAFLDLVSGSPIFRSLLPLLNRTGQSVVPALLADRLRGTAVKSRFFLQTTAAMGLSFCVLSAFAFVLDGKYPAWFPYVFLAIYFVFFSATGANLLAFGTVQGKLIPAAKRGRLMGASGAAGSILAIAVAWFAIPALLDLPRHGFGWLFLIAGVGFLLAALASLFLVEPADEARNLRLSRKTFTELADVFRDDVRFRRLAIVAMLLMCTQNIFPHYQFLGRDRLDAGGFSMMTWLVAQNAGAGIFGSVFGWIADRSGNAWSLRLQGMIAVTTPWLGLALANESVLGGDAYWVTFFLLGLTPVTLRTLTNYVLELCPREQHPRYVGALSISQAIPLLLSAPIGMALEPLGFEAVFAFASLLIGAGAVGAWFLSEPRAKTELASVAE